MHKWCFVCIFPYRVDYFVTDLINMLYAFSKCLEQYLAITVTWCILKILYLQGI